MCQQWQFPTTLLPFFKTGELWGRAILWVKNYKELLHKSWIKIIWREKLSGRMSMTQWVNGCLACLYKWWMMCVCLSVYDIHSHQTSQFHEIFALGLFWTNLGHEKARFSKFWFLRGLPIGSSGKFGPFSVFRGNLSHLKTWDHDIWISKPNWLCQAFWLAELRKLHDLKYFI